MFLINKLFEFKLFFDHRNVESELVTVIQFLWDEMWRRKKNKNKHSK